MFTISKQFYSNNNGDEKQVAMKYNNVDDELKFYENINGKEKTKIEKHFLQKQFTSKGFKENSPSNLRQKGHKTPRGKKIINGKKRRSNTRRRKK